MDTFFFFQPEWQIQMMHCKPWILLITLWSKRVLPNLIIIVQQQYHSDLLYGAINKSPQK